MNDNNEMKVRRGERFRIPAATWNNVIDATKAHKRGRFNKANAVNAGDITDLIKSNSTILLLNDSGYDLADSFKIVRLEHTVLDIALDMYEGNRRIALKGYTPDDPNNAIAIVQVPLEVDSIGKAVVAGVSVCKVKMVSEFDSWANPTPGTIDYLTSDVEGQARILWWGESGDALELEAGIYLAIVNLIGTITDTEVTIIDNGWQGQLTTTHCLVLTVLSATGSCVAVPLWQTIMLSWDDTVEGWTSETEFQHDGGTDVVVVWIEKGRVRLSIGDVELVHIGGNLWSGNSETMCATEATTPCDNFFIIKLECTECADTEETFGRSTPTIVPPGETVTLDIPVVGIDIDIPPSQFQIDVELPEGISQFQVMITDPSGINQYVIIDQPASGVTEGHLLLTPTTGNPISGVTQSSGTLLGQFQANDDFGQLGNNNGVWQFQFTNFGLEPIIVNQFQFQFGIPPNPPAFGLDGTPAFLQFQVEPDNTELPATYQFQVDWDDGNIEYYLPSQAPFIHEYALPGTYNVDVTAYNRQGGSALQTIVATAIEDSTTDGSGTCADPFVLGTVSTFPYTSPVFTILADTTETAFTVNLAAGTFIVRINNISGPTTGIGNFSSVDCFSGGMGTFYVGSDGMYTVVSPGTYFIYFKFPSAESGDGTYTFQINP